MRFCLTLLAVQASVYSAEVDFDRDVRPILSDKCFQCHGPDAQQRQADLRLDTPQGAGSVVKAGLPAKSKLIHRITTKDLDERMPPAESKLRLSAREIEILRAWVKQGAKWDRHWSFRPVERPKPPALRSGHRSANPIDQFVGHGLKKAGLKFAQRADRRTLIRRVTFDLTGLPPIPAEVEAFVNDESPDAYERLVDRLLANPRFGERMATPWLDLARYADTYGYQSDVDRRVWPYRDWVIRSFNRNLSYDRFVTEQIAGDLLPNATPDQILATAFNRLHRQTNEGGSIEDEFRKEYVADRVHTFGTTFLGLTLECCRCHDHKFDPVSQAEYYGLAAFFNSIDESGLYSHFTRSVPTPTLLLATSDQRRQLKTLAAQIAKAEKDLAAFRKTRDKAFAKWLAQAKPPKQLPGLLGSFSFDNMTGGKLANAVDAKSPGLPFESPQLVAGKQGKGIRLTGENGVRFALGGNFTRHDAFSIGLWMKTPDHKDRAVLFHRSRAWTDAGSRGYQLLIEDGKISASLIHFWPGNAIRIRTREAIPVGKWTHVVMAYDGSSQAAGLTLFVNGKRADSVVVRDHLTREITGGGANRLTIGQRFRDRGFKNGEVDEFRIFNRAVTEIEAAHLVDGRSIAKLFSERKPTAALFAYFLSTVDPEFRKRRDSLNALRRARGGIIGSISEIMVMREMKHPRPTFVLKRGLYNAPQKQVARGIPSVLPPMKANQKPDRLTLARWLMSPAHPLTSRVAANRLWQVFFGAGLVGTPEDFGSQGARPTHPRLLDWLASEYIHTGWDTKRLARLIVMSETYRQSARGDEIGFRRDPQNVMLSRGPSFPLPAEMQRDSVLFAAGLLVERPGGPPVKPYQPPGLWRDKSGKTYRRDTGEGSRRRSLYTFWKRTSPPPAMMILDAAKRDVCVAKRQRTSSPVAALILLNDPQYIEAARVLAERAMKSQRTTKARIEFLFRRLTSRLPTGKERALLAGVYESQRQTFSKDVRGAIRFLSIGDHRGDASLSPAELAALTIVTQLVTNTHECTTRR